MSIALLIPTVLALMLAAFFAVTDLYFFYFYGIPIVIGIVGAAALAHMNPGRSKADHVTEALRLYFAAHLLYSALRYWLTGEPPPVVGPAAPFVSAINGLGIYPAVKALELVSGLVLLSNRYVPLILVIEMPVSVMIFYLNTFVTADLLRIFTGPTELAVNCALLLAYFQYYKPFLAAKAHAAPPELLGGTGVTLRAHPQ